MEPARRRRWRGPLWLTDINALRAVSYRIAHGYGKIAQACRVMGIDAGGPCVTVDSRGHMSILPETLRRRRSLRRLLAAIRA